MSGLLAINRITYDLPWATACQKSEVKHFSLWVARTNCLGSREESQRWISPNFVHVVCVYIFCVCFYLFLFVYISLCMFVFVYYSCYLFAFIYICLSLLLSQPRPPHGFGCGAQSALAHYGLSWCATYSVCLLSLSTVSMVYKLYSGSYLYLW